MKKQILIVIDTSVASSLALEYIGNLFADRRDVHFQLAHCPHTTCDLLPEPEDQRNSLLPEHQDAKAVEQARMELERAKLKLTVLGVDEERITTYFRQTTSTVQTVLHLAEKELVDAIVIARRGSGIVSELLLGSISSSLFKSCHATPLWVIDGAVKSKNFLVPVDGTPPSLMAIDHLAHIFAGRSDLRIHLFHARGFLSPPPVCRPEDFYERWGKDWCDTNLSGNGCMFTGPTELLTEAGIPKECIITLPEPTTIEESTAIISSAHKTGCGTIVLGRRGVNEKKKRFGGISRRTILQTEDLALWVIG